MSDSVDPGQDSSESSSIDEEQTPHHDSVTTRRTAVDPRDNGHRRDSGIISQQKRTIPKVPWTPEEDAKLLSHLGTDLSSVKWASIGSNMPFRTAKQCRERWWNQLDPTILKGPFTKEEQEQVVLAVKTFGKKWARIKKEVLPHRSDNAIKNFYNTIIKPRAERERNSEAAHLVDLRPSIGGRRNTIPAFESKPKDLNSLGAAGTGVAMRAVSDTYEQRMQESNAVLPGTSAGYAAIAFQNDPRHLRNAEKGYRWRLPALRSLSERPISHSQTSVPAQIGRFDISRNEIYRKVDYEVVEPHAAASDVENSTLSTHDSTLDVRSGVLRSPLPQTSEYTQEVLDNFSQSTNRGKSRSSSGSCKECSGKGKEKAT